MLGINKQLKKSHRSVEVLEEKISRYEDGIKEPATLFPILIGLLALVFKVLYGWDDSCNNADLCPRDIIPFLIVWFAIPCVITAIITTPIKRRYLAHKIKKNKLILQKNRFVFNQMLDTHLLPEVHRLGMATAQDVIDKTCANLLDHLAVLNILEGQVRLQTMQRIKLKNQNLYKSLLSSNQDKMEKVVLEID